MNVIKCEIIDSKQEKIFIKNFNSLTCIFCQEYIRFCDESLIKVYYTKIEEYFNKLIIKIKEDRLSNEEKKLINKICKNKNELLKMINKNKRIYLRKFMSLSCNNLRNNIISLNNLGQLGKLCPKVLVYESDYIDLVSIDKFNEYIKNKNYEIVSKDSKTYSLRKI